jgi:hypothetical protein
MSCRRRRAFSGGTAPIASSTARTEASACTVVQTPQIRCANIPALHDGLDAAPHRGGGVRLRDMAAVNLHLNPQVPLDAGDRIDDKPRHIAHPSSGSPGWPPPLSLSRAFRPASRPSGPEPSVLPLSAAPPPCGGPPCGGPPCGGPLAPWSPAKRC